MGGTEDALIGAIFQVVLGKLASPDFRDLIKGNRETWNLLVKKLGCLNYSITPVLNEAEQKQLSSPTVKKWLDDLTVALYEAADTLDAIGFEALRSRLEIESKSFIGQVKGLVSDSLESLFKTKQDRIEDVINTLEFLVSKKDDLGLGKSSQKVTPQGSPPAPLVEESSTYGRGADKIAIVDFLLTGGGGDSGKKISVISIEAMGGAGKTTLAQLVYNDETVENHFSVRAWVNASSEFTDLTLTRKVFEAVTCKKWDIDDSPQLQVRLMQILEGKRFLLVLDNYSDENNLHWDALKSTLQKVACGSMIVVTTRNGRVSKVTSDEIHRLQTLSREDSLLLFEKHAFSNRDSPVPPELKAIGEKIVDRCEGLPVAIKSLGSYLSSEPDLKEWEKILHCDFFQLYKKEQNILPTLGLSYYNLHPQLKQCFAFSSIFPSGYELEKEQLVLLWMANEFLPREEGKQMEDLGEEYFQALIESSLFQQSRCNQSDRVTIHALNHELATFVSGKSTRRLDGSVSHANQVEARHLSCIGQEGVKQLDLPKESRLSTLLLLGFTGEGSLHHDLTLPEIQSLRAVSLAGSKRRKLPPIQMLKSLRYLNLSSSSIEELPDEICALYYLQTVELSNCKRITRLPTNMRRLVNLRHLNISGTSLTEMPPKMSDLKDLRTLTDFFLAESTGVSIKELGELQHLHKGLAISGLQHVCSVGDVSEASLKEKKHLRTLEFAWGASAETGREEFYEETLEKLHPHTNLEELIITGYYGKDFPNWVGSHSFCNIKFVSLVNCKRCHSLPPLGQLPSLSKLVIKGFHRLETINDEFYSYGPPQFMPFKSLEILYFEDMPQWKSWSFLGDGSGSEGQRQIFSNVKELYLINCPKLNVDVDRYFPSQTKLQRTDQTLVPRLALPRSPQTNTALQRTQFRRRGCLPFP